MNRKKSAFLLPVFIFLMAFLILAGWFFALSRIYLIKEDILSLRRELLESEKKVQDSGSLRRLASGVEEEKIKIDSLFLNESGLIHLIEGLESLGKSSGVEMKMSSVSTSDETGEKPRISFLVEGTFNQVFQYLYHMDNFPYSLNIEKASFQKIKTEKESKGKWRVVFDVKLESYETS